jgi:hypothetical protein
LRVKVAKLPFAFFTDAHPVNPPRTMTLGK